MNTLALITGYLTLIVLGGVGLFGLLVWTLRSGSIPHWIETKWDKVLGLRVSIWQDYLSQQIGLIDWFDAKRIGRLKSGLEKLHRDGVVDEDERDQLLGVLEGWESYV